MLLWDCFMVPSPLFTSASNSIVLLQDFKFRVAELLDTQVRLQDCNILSLKYSEGNSSSCTSLSLSNSLKVCASSKHNHGKIEGNGPVAQWPSGPVANVVRCVDCVCAYTCIHPTSSYWLVVFLDGLHSLCSFKHVWSTPWRQDQCCPGTQLFGKWHLSETTPPSDAVGWSFFRSHRCYM